MRPPFPFYDVLEEMVRKTAASSRYAAQNEEGATDAKKTKAKRRRAVRLFTHDGLGGLGLLPGRLIRTTRPRNDNTGSAGQRWTLYKSTVDGRVGVAALPGDAAGVGD